MNYSDRSTMDYEKCFKDLFMDLLELLQKHAKEWDISEQANYETEEYSDRGGNKSGGQPIVYPPKRKKAAEGNSGLNLR